MEELKIQLREAEERAERERQRAEEGERERQELRQRAEEAERERQELRQRAEEAEERTRPTTLDEYIAACHDSVFSQLTIETDPTLTSKGPITNPRHKWCPTNLRPWSDLLEQQRAISGLLYETFPRETRAFENRTFLVGLGNRISQRSIADERTLEYFLHNSVEDPVRNIIGQLKQVEEVRREFRLGNGIIFENHPHAISDVAEEVVDRETPSTPPSTPGHSLDLNQLRPDQICVYRSDDTRRTMIYISEYKPPHKLTAPHLRLGLRPMNIYKEVVNRETIPTSEDPNTRFQYHAERLTASAITQTYHYMIEGGLEYGLLTTGEMIVFLKIDWAEPETLLYHLAEPSAEVLAHPDHFHICTAVGQYLAFTLMALGERQLHGQDERQRATQELKTWVEDFEMTLRSIPKDEQRAPESSPGYESIDYVNVDRSPYPLRGKKSKRVEDEPVEEQTRRDGGESSDDESGPYIPDMSSPVERRLARRGQGGQGTRRSQQILERRPQGGGGGNDEQEVPYCTQKCLLGLVRGGALDPGCPNLALHSRQDDNHDSNRHGSRRACDGHPITHTNFVELLREQLERSLDDGVTPLASGGARGVLFKVTLLAYGYTFVSKGTVRAFIKDLKHEAAVYERLQPLQGVYVPVFLGAINLQSMGRIYYYDHRVYVVHMTFLSWGGCGIDAVVAANGLGKQLEGMGIRSLRAIHHRGVVHKDVRPANMLFNSETNGVMMIDFERALLLEPPRRPLVPLVPNKRRRKAKTVADNNNKATQKSSIRGLDQGIFSNEIGMVTRVFRGRDVQQGIV